MGITVFENRALYTAKMELKGMCKHGRNNLSLLNYMRSTIFINGDTHRCNYNKNPPSPCPS